jgi:hypothetical protein
MTNTKRMRELLAYACICFRNMTSPFDTIHLQKMNVRLDECGDLSEAIAGMLEEYTIKEEIETAEKLFEETQQ